MNIIAVIPARAGSKGIKDKNIINFCGKPLLAWSILQAKASTRIDKVYVSTDGSNIADIAKQYGADVIERPAQLSSDTASSESALLHAIDTISQSTPVDLVVFLQATSPIRELTDIDHAIDIFLKNDYDSLFSMCQLDDYCIWKETNKKLTSFTYDYKKRGRRQEREPLFLENGSIYLFKPEVLRTENNRLGGRIGMYEMPFNHSYEIDSEADIEICEYFMKKVVNNYEESIL